jgi:GT2 family glycosyltransferase
VGELVTDHLGSVRDRPRQLLVSVIVVNWNRCALLRACLNSLLSQSHPPEEIIVVDNGSSDDSVKMLQSEFPCVAVIRNFENRGFCAANNQGIGIAKGELIALLNNDAEAGNTWVAELARVFEGKPDVGMAASKILIHSNPSRIDKAGHLIWPDGQNRGRGTGAPDDGRYDSEEEVLWPDGCAAMYRKSMLEEIGGFDEDFFAYADDAELGLRARIAGWRCIYNPRAVVRHHRGSTLGVASIGRLKLIERNRVLLAVKLFPWSLLWLNGWYYARRLFAGIRAAAADQGEAALFPGWSGKWRLASALVSGDLDALRFVPRMLRKRAVIARTRKLSPAETRRLILDHTISLKELSTGAAIDV